jgi:hypothetical protein
LLQTSCTAIDAAWATRASTSSATAVATRYCLEHVRTAAKSTPTTRSFAARADTSSGRKSRVHRDPSFGSQSKVQHGFGVAKALATSAAKNAERHGSGLRIAFHTSSDTLFNQVHDHGFSSGHRAKSQIKDKQERARSCFAKLNEEMEPRAGFGPATFRLPGILLTRRMLSSSAS